MIMNEQLLKQNEVLHVIETLITKSKEDHTL
ncbi:unnamed protein product, partial [Didymodactylos carnosus]